MASEHWGDTSETAEMFMVRMGVSNHEILGASFSCQVLLQEVILTPRKKGHCPGVKMFWFVWKWLYHLYTYTVYMILYIYVYNVYIYIIHCIDTCFGKLDIYLPHLGPARARSPKACKTAVGGVVIIRFGLP